MRDTLFATIVLVVMSLCIIQFTLYQNDKKYMAETKDENLFSENKFDDKVPDIQSEEIKTTESGMWEKVWEDTFDDADDSNYKWNFVNKGNNYNNELQFYKEENSQIQGGILHLIGKEESYKNHQYTSGKITTFQKKHFINNRIEIRAKLPAGQGFFPAVWLLPADQNKTLPEIDVFEAVGNDPSTIYMVNHLETNEKTLNYSNTYSLPSYYNFHDYVIEWDEEEIRWYVDKELVFTSRNGVPEEPMYLIINLAIGGNWPGKPNSLTPFPSSLDIDYVKVYKKIGG